MSFDLLDTLIGFLLGTAIGAAGGYYSSKATDARRAKEKQSAVALEWTEFCNRYPLLSAEMKNDFRSEEGRTTRVFFLKSSKTSMGRISEPAFAYYTDEHRDLQAAVRYMAELGYVLDITPGNTPMYEITERFYILVCDSTLDDD
ncbi:MAG: hypothetical protein NXH85_07685 [Pseudomonadaceae bacterium]|nr:hypothetical protein [Pseudomonadaceae bacterium]